MRAAEKCTTLKPFQPSFTAFTALASARPAPWTPGTDSAPPPKISIGRSAPLSASVTCAGSLATSEASSPSHSVLYVRSVSGPIAKRSEEQTSELQSLMRISYDVFCLKKKIKCYRSYFQYVTLYYLFS